MEGKTFLYQQCWCSPTCNHAVLVTVLVLELPGLESLCDKAKRLQQSTAIGKKCLELKLWGWGKEFPHPAYPCSAILTSSSQALLCCSNFHCKKFNVNKKITALYLTYAASCLVCLNLPVLHKRCSVFFQLLAWGKPYRNATQRLYRYKNNQ